MSNNVFIQGGIECLSTDLADRDIESKESIPKMVHVDQSNHGSGYADLSFGNGYQEFGCTVNRLRIEALFQQYKENGFLYPSKLERMKPYIGLILNNWKKSVSLKGDKFLHNIVEFDRPQSGAWATVSYWASTNGSVHSQHLVSNGHPEGSRAVLLASQTELDVAGHTSCQNWFRSSNRFPAKVFGSAADHLGNQRSVSLNHSYISLPRTSIPDRGASATIHQCQDSDSMMVYELSRRLCGRVRAIGDEWFDGDLNLMKLDARYQEAGLRRYRRVFVATRKGYQDPVGLCVAYRGALGLNFSFLENRCELSLDPMLNNEERLEVLEGMIHSVQEVYEDFELPSLLLCGDMQIGNELVAMGGSRIQDYTQSMWLADGFRLWYEHTNRFYEKVIRMMKKREAKALVGAG